MGRRDGWGARRRPAARLSRRGRATLVVLIGVGLAALTYTARGLMAVGSEVAAASAEPSVPVDSPAAGAPAAPAGVSAGPPVERLAGGSSAMLPDWLLTRLPVSSGDYRVLLEGEDDSGAPAARRWVEQVPAGGGGWLRVEYSFDSELTRRVLRVLDRGRVRQGHVIVLDPESGRLLAYVSTDTEHFPPDRPYPAASLVKVVTAAAALHYAPERARETCLYRGNPYRLTRARLRPPPTGHSASLERALATSNNQCFAQLAVAALGSEALLAAIQSFGWLEAPAPGHAAGSVDPGEDDYDLGRLGCGLDGCRITPLHAAQLAATLATGLRVTPFWIERVSDERGLALPLPRREAPRRVMSRTLTEELRSMLVRTTTHGTARGAFRDRRGRPKLGAIRVAGKTGNLSGRDPNGRYEWFIGAAPASDPTIAVAVLQLQGHKWWKRSSEIAADVLVQVFCERGRCEPGLKRRFTDDPAPTPEALLLSEAPRP